MDLLLSHLGSRREGLSKREAARRREQHGPNEIQRRQGSSRLREFARQFTHPLALLLWVAVGSTVAGLPLADALLFAIGLFVANVSEGLLPTITLALAVGVRRMARRRALLKRLNAVETLGSTDVICTDKTGTLTEGRMVLSHFWADGEELDPESDGTVTRETLTGRARELAEAANMAKSEFLANMSHEIRTP